MCETVPLRPRRESRIDRRAEDMLAACGRLLRKNGCCGVYIGYNGGEARTESAFNPLNDEIHDAGALITESYMARHFVQTPYREKMRIIRRVRDIAQKGPLRGYLPFYRRTSMDHSGGSDGGRWRSRKSTGYARLLSITGP